MSELRQAMVDAGSSPSTIDIDKPFDVESLIPLKDGKEYHFGKVEDAGFT